MKTMEEIKKEIEKELNKINDEINSEKEYNERGWVKFNMLSGNLQGLETACHILGFEVIYNIEKHSYTLILKDENQ